ncbi:MAG: hypothetical protein WD063_20345 [Pirellulales bacterium]
MVAHAPPPPEDQGAALKPPQFTLRTLLVVMTALACLFAVMTAVGSAWSLAILLLLALVSAHVLGNAAGTKLRDRSVRRPIVRSRDAPSRAARTREFASPKRLTEPARLHWITLVMSLGGALAGGYFGGSALAASYPDASAAAVVLGVVSSGVLGGFAGFATSSFLWVMRQALSEAHAGSDRHKPRAVRRPPE